MASIVEVMPTPNRLDLIPGTLEHLVLQALRERKPMHGFEVLERIREATEGELVVEESAVYPALHRMERRGWLSAEWAVSPKGRRAKYYELTAKGRRALEREAETWRRYVEAVARLARG